jgi:hypothetical protein
MKWRRSLSWNPTSLDWRVAALFMTGSLIFALGSFPPFAESVDAGVVGVTFFLGSIFFTGASYSQFLQTINGPDDGSRIAGSRFRIMAWQPHRVLYWATLIQLAGTLFFNASTYHAMATNLSTGESNRLVWAPDFFGSIAFLVASHLAWMFVCRRLWCVCRNSRDWWVAALNYVGSIFFMLSAIGAFIQPATDELVNARLANAATFIGALCFLAGAYLLLPAVREAGNAHCSR